MRRQGNSSDRERARCLERRGLLCKRAVPIRRRGNDIDRRAGGQNRHQRFDERARAERSRAQVRPEIKTEQQEPQVESLPRISVAKCGPSRLATMQRLALTTPNSGCQLESTTSTAAAPTKLTSSSAPPESHNCSSRP